MATTTKRKTTARTKKTAAPKAKQAGLKLKDLESARNVFLAGLGAYDKAREEAQTQIEENRARVEELLTDLVKRGAKVETTARKKIAKLDLPELKIPEIKLADREAFQTRIDKARESFHTLRDAIKQKTA